MPNFDPGPSGPPAYTCGECDTRYDHSEDGWGPQSCPRCASTQTVSFGSPIPEDLRFELPETRRGAMYVPYRVVHKTEKAALVAIPVSDAREVEVWVPFKHFSTARHTDQGVETILDRWFQEALKRDIMQKWGKGK